MILYKKDDTYILQNEDELIIATDNSTSDYFRRLSTKNCDEIFGVVDVDKLGKQIWDNLGVFTEQDKNLWFGGFRNGFKESIELNKDKRFTLEDMRKAYNDGRHNINCYGEPVNDLEKDFQDTIQSLQQPTEIEVEIITEEDFIFDPSMGISQGFNYDKQKLDENGCLILKRK